MSVISLRRDKPCAWRCGSLDSSGWCGCAAFSYFAKAMSVNVQKKAGREGLGREAAHLWSVSTVNSRSISSPLRVRGTKPLSFGETGDIIMAMLGGQVHSSGHYLMWNEIGRIGRVDLVLSPPHPLKNTHALRVNYLRRHTFRVTTTNDLFGIPRHRNLR